MTARKEHHCGFCSRTIDKGERYLYQFGLDAGGLASSWRTCWGCDVLVGLIFMHCDPDDGVSNLWDYVFDVKWNLPALRLWAWYRLGWRHADGSVVDPEELPGTPALA